MKYTRQHLRNFPLVLNRISMIFLLIGCVFLSHISGQQNKRAADFPDNCELITGKLDLVGISFNELKSEGAFLIIIGKYSNKESSGNVRQTFLSALRYLTKFHNISEKETVYAAAESSSKLNRLQFFVNGKLLTEIINPPKTERLCNGDGEVL